MKEDRRRLTEATVAQGAAEATRITSDADGKKVTLMAAAEGRAKQIQGQGDAEAARYYEMLNADPYLAMILRNFEALRNTLYKDTTIILPPDVEPFIYLRTMPDVTPVKPEDAKK